jgi:type III secretion protein V
VNVVLSVLNKIGQRKDVLLAILLISVVFMMILPLPTVLVDILIGTNMGVAVILMMLAVYIATPLEFSAFPSVLLITTLFRLALSITTTRLILLQADAGQIVETFGTFVVGGNLVVGIVVFLIITIVQFLVITKGAERVAEVSARFSLDAMPGKQMSIDGDLRAGIINAEEARSKRLVIEKESQLYGSMDGAMKFVKGDAIAGLIIILVNILGGVAIGVWQKGMSASDAMHLYSILTVGDGLVAQIPALLIAITSGIIVTRVTQEDGSDLGSDIGHQVMNQPRAFLVGGLLLLIFAMIPGFPTTVFLVLSVLFAGSGYWAIRSLKRASASENSEPNTWVSQGAKTKSAQSAVSGNSKERLAKQEEFALTVPLLIDLEASMKQSLQPQELNEALAKVRRALYLDLGVPYPGIHVRFNESMPAGEYHMKLDEVPVASGQIRVDSLLVSEHTDQLDLLQVPYEESTPFLPKLKSIWVHEEYEEHLSKSGIQYFKPSDIITYHLAQVLKDNASSFIGIQEARYLLEQMEGSFAELVKEVQRLLPMQKLTEVLQRLVSEEISIRNMRSILEALVEWAQKEKDVVQLTEYVRSSLSRYICYKYANGQNIMPAYLLDQGVEDSIRNGIRQTSAGSYLALDPSFTQEFLVHVKSTIGELENMTLKPVLIVSMDIRRYVKKLIESDYYDLPVLSFQELTPKINVQPLGRVVM